MDDEERLVREAARKLGAQMIIVHPAHGEAAEELVHLRMRAGPGARHVHLGHVGVVVGAVRGHGLDVEEERLA